MLLNLTLPLVLCHFVQILRVKENRLLLKIPSR